MILFINDKKIKITEKSTVLNKSFDVVLKNIGDALPQYLIGKVLIVGSTKNIVNKFVDLIEGQKLKKLTSVTFLVADKASTLKSIKSNFKIIKAGGGIVKKENKILLIHRLGVWDFPKGKLDEGESIKECAEREVHEETGVKAKIEDKIYKSYHTYARNHKRVLKKTYWYNMECLDDRKMKAQKEEHIDDVKWCTIEEAELLLANSYNSLQFLLDKYIDKTHNI